MFGFTFLFFFPELYSTIIFFIINIPNTPYSLKPFTISFYSFDFLCLNFFLGFACVTFGLTPAGLSVTSMVAKPFWLTLTIDLPHYTKICDCYSPFPPDWWQQIFLDNLNRILGGVFRHTANILQQHWKCKFTKKAWKFLFLQKWSEFSFTQNSGDYDKICGVASRDMLCGYSLSVDTLLVIQTMFPTLPLCKFPQ